MNKILVLFFIALLFWNCAGSLMNPYIEDVYGEKKNLIEGGAVLLEIKQDQSDPDIYLFRIIENIAMSNKEREKNRIKTILKYYTDFCLKNNYIGFEELNVEYEQKLNTGWFWHTIKFSRVSNHIKLIKNYSNNKNMIEEMMPYIESMTKIIAVYYMDEYLDLDEILKELDEEEVNEELKGYNKKNSECIVTETRCDKLIADCMGEYIIVDNFDLYIVGDMINEYDIFAIETFHNQDDASNALNALCN